jgi:hypothetical protein
MSTLDNINVKLPTPLHSGDRNAAKRLKELVFWLRERDIKYSYVFRPEWDTYPYAINMRKEDALALSLAFDL